MSVETVSRGYDYSKRTRISSQSLFLSKSQQQNIRIPEGWKTIQQTDSISVSRVRSQFVESKKHFELTKTISLAIPSKLEGLMSELEHSKYILKLKRGWDGESADSYNPETLKSAITFLCRYLMWSIDNHKAKLCIPKIYHGPDGSIDLLWSNEIFSLLINIDNTGNNGQFSGEIFEIGNQQSSEGNFNVNSRTFEFLPAPTAF
jgi:hypothetical protein